MPRKKTGGRQKGTRNKLTEKAIAIIAEAVLELQKEHETSLLTWCKGDWNKYYTVIYKHTPISLQAPLSIRGKTQTETNCDWLVYLKS